MWRKVVTPRVVIIGEAQSDGVSAEDEMDVVFKPVVIPKVLDQVLSMGEAEGKPLNDEEAILVTKEEMHDGDRDEMSRSVEVTDLR